MALQIVDWPLSPKTPTNASSFFGGLDGSLGFSLLVWVAGRWCPPCLFNPSIGSPPLSFSFGPGGGWRAEALPIIWRLKLLIFGAPAPEPQRPRQTPVVSSEAWMEVLAFLFWFVWVAGRWCPLSLLSPSVGLCPPLLARASPPTYKDLRGWRLESPDPLLYPADRPGHGVLRKMCLGPPPLEKRARVKTSAAENPSDRPKKPD